MANKTIIVEIKALVNDISSKLRSVTGDINKFAQSNSVLQRTLGLLDTTQKNSIKSLKGMSDGQKAVTKGFLGLDQATKSVAQRYAKLDDAQKKVGNSYKQFVSSVGSGSHTLTAANKKLIDQWTKLPAHAKGAITSFHKLSDANKQLVSGYAGLDSSIRKNIRTFTSMPAPLQKAHSGILNFAKASTAAGKEATGFGGKLEKTFHAIGRGVLNFNNIARTMTSSSRAIGTSMIFAGGAFRQLGVGINVTSSLFQTFVPMLGHTVTALSQLGPAGLAVGAAIGAVALQVTALLGVLAAAGIGIFALLKSGLNFNAAMEENTVTVATLILQYKDLRDAQGKLINDQNKYTAAQFDALKPAEQQIEIDRRRTAVTNDFRAAISNAQLAVTQLTVAAADSKFTTQELLGAFQATFSVLGKYNISSEQAAKLTGQFARVASVAGVSAANLASQMTLWLTGAGRITSPLARFAEGIGLGKKAMKELNDELQKNRGSEEATAKIINRITNLLTVFNVGGRLMSDTWNGIMSNMQESFALFAGLVTKDFFTLVRNAIFNFDDLKEGAERATGAMTKIFKIDPKTGTFFTNIQNIADVFQEPFKKAADVLQRLINTIGKDVAKAIDSLASGLESLATWIGDNEIMIQEIYFTVQSIIGVIGTLILSVASLLGVSTELNTTTSRLYTLLDFIHNLFGAISIIVSTIQITLGLIFTGLSGIVSILILLIENLGRGMYDIYANVFNISAELQNWSAHVANFISSLLGLGNLVVPISFRMQILGGSTGGMDWMNENITNAGRNYTQGGIDSFNRTSNYGKSRFDAFSSMQGETKAIVTKARNSGSLGEGSPSTDFSNMTDSQVYSAVKNYELSQLTAKRNKETPKPGGGAGKGAAGKGGAGKAKSDRKQVLDTLFDVNKEYAEKEIQLAQDVVENQIGLNKELIEGRKTLLENALEDNKISFENYFYELDSLRKVDLANSLTSIKVETNALKLQHEINKREFQQQRLEAEAAYQASEKTAAEKQKLAIKIAQINRKEQTETLEFTRQNNKLTAEASKLSTQDTLQQIKNLRELRENLRGFFEEVRNLQRELDSALGNVFDVDAVKRMESSISEAYIKQYDLFVAQGAAGEKGRKLLTEFIALQTERFKISNAQKILEIESFEITRALTVLEEKRRTGYIGTLEFQKQSAELNVKNIEFLQKQLQLFQEQFSDSKVRGDLTTQLELRDKILEAQKQLNEAQNVTETVLLRINGELRDATKDFLGTVLDDVTSLGDAFLNLGKTIQKAFQKALIDKLFQSKGMQKIFGSEDQESGKATGIGAWLGRAMGVDGNSNAAVKNSSVEFKTVVTSTAASLKELGAEVDESLRILSAARKKETEEIDKKIETLSQTITGQANITVTGDAVFDGIKLPSTEAPSVVSTGGGSSSASGIVDLTSGLIGKSEKLNKSEINAFLKKGGGMSSINAATTSWCAAFINSALAQLGLTGSGSNVATNFAKWGIKVDPKNIQAGDVLVSMNGKKIGQQGGHARIATGNTQMRKDGLYLENISGNSGKNADMVARGWVKADAVVARRSSQVGTTSPYFDPLKNGSTAGFNPNNPNVLAGSGLKPLLDPATMGQATTPVSIESVAPSAAQEQANALKEQVKEASGILASKSEGVSGSTEDSILNQISLKLDSIITALGEGGLGLIRTAVTSIDTKMGGGLMAELSTFSLNLSTMLTTLVTTPIVTAVQMASIMNATSPSNIQEKAFGGYISGPGGPTADKVPAWLSNGEYVIKAAAVKALGMDKLHQLNNADKVLPEFGFGGFVSGLGGLFKNIGKFFKGDTGKMILGTVAPMLLQKFLPKGAKPYSGLISMGLLGGLDSFGKNTPKYTDSTKGIPNSYFGNGSTYAAKGGLIGKFAGGGLIHKSLGGLLPGFADGGGSAGGGGGAGAAAKAGGIAAAFAIGMALFGRWRANKQKKKELEEYKKNRVKDPFGLNPDTLTFYKKPIITGTRDYLAKGGLAPQTSGAILRSMPQFAMGGTPDINLDEILKDAGVGESPINLNQNINITTPDVHSFRNSRGQLERDLARVTQRGLKRRAPKY